MKKRIIIPIILATVLISACGAKEEYIEPKSETIIMKNPISHDDAVMKAQNSPTIAKAIVDTTMQKKEEIIEKVEETVVVEEIVEETVEQTVEETAAVVDETVVEEIIVEEIVEVESIQEPVQDSCFDENVQTGNYYYDLPDETSLAYQEPEPTYDQGMQYVGDYYVTFYSADEMGSYGSANGYGSVPWATCAAGYDIPFGTIVYVGDPINRTFEVRDRGVGSGSIDIFVSSSYEIPSWGAAYIPTYIVAWGDGRTAWGYE